MKKAVFLLIALLVTSTFAEFRLDRVDVTVSDIKKDGSAKIEERIKIIVIGLGDQGKYKAGINNNDISYWSATTKINEIRRHINEEVVDVRNFNLKPLQLSSKKCNPLVDLCHGELVLEYEVYPHTNNETNEIIANTGLFTVDSYKPRTIRYKLNPDALTFRSPEKTSNSASTLTSEDVVIIDSNIYFSIIFPENTRLVDINQPPNDVALPSYMPLSQLTWNDAVLTQFLFVFDVEEGLDDEVLGFFSRIPKNLQNIFAGEQSIATIIIIIILIGSYVYLRSLDKK
ncbi:hypothetical protein HYT84_01515 [Candidatus Micrarchaeota archaeon]|nr:hypothetical protein [Candidatus Micrarchaeota archaeon]